RFNDVMPVEMGREEYGDDDDSRYIRERALVEIGDYNCDLSSDKDVKERNRDQRDHDEKKGRYGYAKYREMVGQTAEIDEETAPDCRKYAEVDDPCRPGKDSSHDSDVFTVAHIEKLCHR
ncbi:MAG: hypothetical protein HOC71_19580, partial [Candidatus Latescibacteria bacterium]|nr:hypothetical protein [Candidatus Latescibacterota bacterium]